MVSYQNDQIVLKQLEKRIVEITYKSGLSHLSSTLSSLPIIYEIYKTKKEDEVFILSNGHAGLALYVIIEFFYGISANYLLGKHGIHPNRCLDDKIYCSTGSLGSGLPIAVGHALSDRSKMVYCLISDGECAEGSIWEALALTNKLGLENLKVYVNINGLSATEKIDCVYLMERLNAFLPNKNILHLRYNTSIPVDFTSGVESHYHKITDKEYETYVC